MMLRTQELIGMMLKRAKGMMLRTQELMGMMLRTQELIGMRDSVRGGSKGQLKVWANQALRRPQ